LSKIKTDHRLVVSPKVSLLQDKQR